MKNIVFDFDGTIADTFPVVEEIGKHILKQYGIEVDLHEARQIGLQRIMIRSKFPKWEIPKAVDLLRKELNLRIADEVSLFPGMDTVLKELKKKYHLGIVSSNSEANIRLCLDRNKVLDLFSFIYSGSSLFGKHIVLKQLCKTNQIEYQDIIYIGDEDRDIQAAKRLGISIIAVPWGYNTKENLLNEKPSFLAENPKHLLEIISSI